MLDVQQDAWWWNTLAERKEKTQRETLVSRDDLRSCRGCEAKISVTEGKQASIRSVRSHAHQSLALTVKRVHNYSYIRSGAFYKRPFFPSLGARRSWKPWPSLGEKKKIYIYSPRFNKVGLRSSRKSRAFGAGKPCRNIGSRRDLSNLLFSLLRAGYSLNEPARFPSNFLSNLPGRVPATPGTHVCTPLVRQLVAQASRRVELK